MICPTCATENRPGAKFCIECGTALAAGCPNCGTQNPPGAKFCSECATPLIPRTAGAAPSVTTPTATPSQPSSAGGAVAERRLVSVLFADLVDWTRIAESGDAEDARDLLSRYFELASDVIRRYGGVVEKFIGDAVMAVWGAPITREDDPERAVRAAMDLVDAVRSLGPGIQARAAVLTGEAAVTIGATNQGMVAGDLVNTASRLQGAAAPGIVLVGEATHRAASGSIVFEPAGEQVLKGKAAPVEAWRAVRIVAERGGRNRSEGLEAPFVGRDEELRQLKDLFHATEREGKSRLVSVMGPAGIGKSRLAWEFLKYLDGVLGRVWFHAGRSPAYGEGVTFWALGEMIRGRAGLAETDDEATTRERIAATVREHITDDAERPWIENALLTLLGFGTGAAASEQLFAAWRTFFERLASTSPVVMLFEDLHHADNGLLDFVDHLLEWSRSSPIMVITLARPELVEKRPDWGVGKRAFSSIHLEPMAEADMEQLLAGLVPGLPRAAAASIVNRADGIPLYAIETVRMLLAQGRLVLEGNAYHPVGDIGDVAVPETLTALIAARLDSLEPADRTLIEDAAVLGQSFTVAGLSAVAGVPAGELEPKLRAFVRRELLVLDADPRSPERGQYAFVQALIREVAYNTLSKKDRKSRHLAAARFFESLGSDELAGGLAGHYLAAQRLAADEAEAAALSAQARIALRGAAERAAALGSHEQARTFIEQALEVTTDPAERADLHERGLRAALQNLEPEPIFRHAEAAVAERRRAGDRAATAVAVANHAMAFSNVRNDPAAAIAMLRSAWEEFGDLEQTAAGVELMVALGRSLGFDEPDEALVWIERYLPIAERLGLLDHTTRGILGRGRILVTHGRPREGIVLLRGSHQLAEAHGLTDVELNARILLTFYEQWGDPAAGVELGREGLEIGQRLGARAYGHLLVGNTTLCALRVGEWDWADALLDEWIALEGALGNQAELHVDRAVLRALRGADQGQDIEASARIRADFTDPQYESYELYARAWAGFAGGDPPGAMSLAERAVDTTGFFGPLALPLSARASLWNGDAARTRELLQRLAAGAWWGLALEADRAALDAGVAALEGRGSDALAGYREALRSYGDLRLGFDAAMTGLDMAILLPAADREAADVAAAIATARETFARLRARPFLDRLDAALASGRGASPAASSASAQEALTPSG